MFSRTFRQAASQATRGARAFSSNAGGSGGTGAVALLGFAGAGFAYYDYVEKELLETRMNEIQVELAGKTNAAFVFIKPHACKGNPGAVESVVEQKFKASGIRVTGSGEILAEDIDSKQYIGEFL